VSAFLTGQGLTGKLTSPKDPSKRRGDSKNMLSSVKILAK